MYKNEVSNVEIALFLRVYDMSKIIYLNGPSSSGKTTLAQALQQSFEELFLHLGIDKIIGFMPAKVNNWEGGDAPIGFCWKPDVDPTGHPTYHIHAGPFAKKIVRSLKDIALLLIAQHYNLIIDDVAFGITGNRVGATVLGMLLISSPDQEYRCIEYELEIPYL